MNIDQKQGSFSRLNIVFLIIIVVSIIASYLKLNLIYNIEDVDDAWSLSFMYNAFVRHIPPEVTFGGGLAPLKIFGLTQAYIYSGILNCIGWTKPASHLVSMLFMLLAAIAWYGILTTLKFPRKFSLFFSLLVLWCEPFFRSALLSRPESLTFFLVSLAFYFLVREKYLFAGLLAVVSVENHPMGIIFFVYALAWAASQNAEYWKDKRLPVKKILPFLAGLACGLLYYFGLHFQGLNEGIHTIRKGAMELPDSVLYQYFFTCVNYYRHLADLFFFCLCLILFIWKKLYKENRFVLLFFLFIVAANFINPRGNYQYTLYFYPAFLLMALFVFEKLRRLEWAVLVFFLIFFVYNASVVYRKRNYDFNKYITKIQDAVPRDNLPVVGSTNEWYAFKDREFYAGVYTCNFDTTAPAFYLIEGNDFRKGLPGDKNKKLFKDYLTPSYSGTLLKSLEINNEQFNIKLMKKNYPPAL
jgi:hypothetical protein